MRGANILISGAGIAGAALAYWLAVDHRVTVLERARALTSRGQVISLKGTGVQVLRKMGLYEALCEHRFAVTHTRFMTRAGRTLRQVQVAEAEQTLGGYVMTRRADLHQLLLDARPTDVAVRLGTELRSVRPGPAGVAVDLSDGASETYDLLLGADGVHSLTRELTMPEVQAEFLHGHYFAFGLRHDHGWDPTEARAVFGGGRNVNLLPKGPNALGVVVYQDDQGQPPPMGGPAAGWRSYFEDAYRDYPQFCRAAFAAIRDDDDIFADRIVMVPAQRLASGRIALVGDAGSCPTFMSGMGAAAALQGAYCLASQLKRRDDIPSALRAYEARMLPIVRGYQQSARSMRAMLLARSTEAQLVRDLGLQFMPKAAFQARARKFYHGETDVELLTA
ncbi:MAG: FAD-dependent monooxygenase [Phenylobacterium sp.]